MSRFVQGFTVLYAPPLIFEKIAGMFHAKEFPKGFHDSVQIVATKSQASSRSYWEGCNNVYKDLQRLFHVFGGGSLVEDGKGIWRAPDEGKIFKVLSVPSSQNLTASQSAPYLTAYSLLGHLKEYEEESLRKVHY